MGAENRPVESHGRWVIVSIDDVAVQCCVPAEGGGVYFVKGYSENSIRLAADYARSFGTSYATEEEARDSERMRAGE